MYRDSAQHLNEGLGAIMPLIGFLTSHVRQHVSRICRDVGYELTPEEADTLMIIHHFNGLPQSKLASILGKDKAAVTRLMNSLVKSGLVCRAQDKKDRRIVRANITEEGKAAFVQVWPELKQFSDQALAGLPEAELTQLCQTLGIINTNLAALCEQIQGCSEA